MQLHFTGRNVEVTPALKTFTTEKLERLKKRAANITNINVTFHIENVTHIAEANLHVDGIELHASANGSDMYSAIDMLVDKLLTQLTKHKEKTDHH
jgi:putative sigma-54 modulation protein